MMSGMESMRVPSRSKRQVPKSGPAGTAEYSAGGYRTERARAAAASEAEAGARVEPHGAAKVMADVEVQAAERNRQEHPGAGPLQEPLVVD